MKLRLAAGFLAVAVAVASLFAWQYLASGARDTYGWSLPEEYPVPAVPPDNPMSEVKVALGRRLFYDTRLSSTDGMSCATCHMQSHAFTDGRPHAIGATGERHPRNTMSLVNVAYATRLTWANNLLDRLEDQALTPLFSEHPVEMGLAGSEADIVTLLRNDGRYQDLFRSAFPNDADPYSILNLVRATSAFVRSIVSFESPYDHFVRGDTNAMNMSALRGMDLFFSERLECFHCHGGFNFSDSSTHASATVAPVGFHNNGLYNIDGEGGYPPDNTGLHDLTGNRRDMGRFRAPSLRNVVLTAPYMHDGSLESLDEVIDHYSRGGRHLEEGQYAGDGRLSPYKSEFIRGFELTTTERADLLAFLDSLTDPRVTRNQAWSDPRASGEGGR